MLVTLKSNAPGAVEITLTDGTTSANTWITEAADFGNSVWEHRFAGARGTQGSRPAQGTPLNRPLVLPVEVRRDTKDLLAATLSQLYDAMDEVRRFGGRVKFKSSSQTYAQYFELLATDGARIEEWGHKAEDATPAYSVTLILSAQCAPYLVGDSMTVWDDFSVNSITDYTFDAGSGTLSVSGGQLVPSSTAHKALYHSARGYTYSDVQATLKIVTGSSVAGNVTVGLSLRRQDINNYLIGQVFFNGASSTLAIYEKDDGSFNNLVSSGTFTTATSTTYWLRFRGDGNVLTVEWFTSEPTPMGTPAQSATHTLSGANATEFGVGVSGQAGIWTDLIPTTYRYDNFVVEPFTYRNQTLPTTLSLRGSIPGDAPALADVTITPSGGSAAPIFALVGWTQRAASGGVGSAPFGIFEAEDYSSVSGGWTTGADAGSRGGSRLADTTATDAETYRAVYTIDPNILVPDDYTQGELNLEVWVVAIVGSTLVSPLFTLSARSSRGTTFGTERFSLEYGSFGKLLTTPSSGTVRRFVRLGTVPLVVDRARPQAWQIVVAGDVGPGSSGVFGMDYLVMVPVRQRALSPTGEANDASYPDFVASTSETVKLIRSDLSGAILTTSTTGATYPDHGLGGSLLEFPPGDVDMLLKLSSLAPDDPTVDTTTEQLAHSATVSVSVTPRWHMLRV